MKLAEAVAKHAWTFPLSATPVPASIQVGVDGSPLTTGWTYDAGANAVVLEPISGHTRLTITYAAGASCP